MTTTTADVTPPEKKKLALHWQILIAIILAFVVGLSCDPDATFLGTRLEHFLDFLGTLFLNALKMVVVPLVAASIVNGISGIAGGREFGRLGVKTICYYAATSLCAILLGMTIINLVSPGTSGGHALGNKLGLTQHPTELMQQAEGKGPAIDTVFLQLIPPNIIAAAADGQMLGLIFFSLLFGYYINYLKRENKKTMERFWLAVFDIMMNITMLIMRFAPIGIFGLVGKAVLAIGLDVFLPLLSFFLSVFFALSAHMLITMSLGLYFIGRVNPFLHLKAMVPVLVTAFSTSSSAATLPVNLEVLEKDVGVSNKVSSFVLPLGSTLNMDGTALYECVAAIFIAQAYGIDLSFTTQFTILLLAMLTAVGVAGIPSASLVAITLILHNVGLPTEGVGLILITDRILDMCRSVVNVYSDSCCAVVIARSEGERTKVARKRLLKR